MSVKKICLLFVLLIASALSHLYAIMVTSTKIAYVDIERIYYESRGVEASRMELEELIKSRRKKIQDAEKAVAGVRKNLKPAAKTTVVTEEKKYNIVKSTLPEYAANLSSATVVPEYPVNLSSVTAITNTIDKTLSPAGQLPSFEVEEMEKSLAETEKLIEEMMEETRVLIMKKENELRIRLMAKIYDVIKTIALEEGYSVIVDKEVLFYSEDAVEDITDRVIRSLNED